MMLLPTFKVFLRRLLRFECVKSLTIQTVELKYLVVLSCNSVLAVCFLEKNESVYEKKIVQINFGF